MGGLRRYLPWTFGLMLIATLAISGIPPLSGFFSKDEILAAAFGRGEQDPIWRLFWAMGLVAAFLVSVIPAMIHQFQVLVHDFPGYFATLQDRSARFRVFSDRFHLTSKIQGLLTSLPGRLGSRIRASKSTTASYSLLVRIHSLSVWRTASFSAEA